MMHLPCLTKYFRAQTEPRCPQCKQFWPHRIPGKGFHQEPLPGAHHMYYWGGGLSQGLLSFIVFCGEG